MTQQKSPRITDGERATVAAGLEAGLGLPAIAKRMGASYGRVYRIANQAGAFDARREQARARKLAAEQQRRADEARLPVLLAAYHRGDLVDEGDTAARVCEAVLVWPALASRDPRRILHALDSLVVIRQQEVAS